jgi:hypothetical protein
MKPDNRLLFPLTALLCLAAVPACLADDDEYPPGTPLPPGYVRSIDVMTSGFTTANSLELASEYAAMMHNYDQALALAKMAVQMDDNDLDVHLAYAQALQAKVDGVKDPDPKLFNQCIKEWLIVMRSERGPEKGLTKKNGAGNKRINKLFEDEDHAILAAMHLKALVGRVPKDNESDSHFMKDVGKPVELEVTGKVLTHGKSQPQSDPLMWMK